MKNAMLITLTRKFSLGRRRGWGPGRRGDVHRKRGK
jgi:hypothetical protein